MQRRTCDLEGRALRAGGPARLRSRQFEPADVSTTRPSGSTGLRLAIRRDLASLMGGATVTSRKGQGSVFPLRLPPARVGDAGDDPSTAHAAALAALDNGRSEAA
jgi:hypothetical protein